MLDMRHNNAANNHAMQFSGSFFDQNLFFRKTNNNASQSWSRILLETDGKVGIGTTSPLAKFQVAGDAGTAPLVRLGGGIDYGGVTVLNIAPGTIMFDAPGLTGGRLSILGANGNVGIGTPSPDAKLAVNGTIHAKEIKVDMNVPFPDYVFSDHYILQPLSQVEVYIAKNRHLPEIPSAAEVDRQGLNLGEMNRLLVKKIEELMLYLIEGHKKNKQQQVQINQLSRKFSSQSYSKK